MADPTYADSEELEVRFSDIENVLHQEVLETEVEDIVQEPLVWRQAFRDYDATNLNSDQVSFPIPDDAMGNPKIVGEGAEFHRDQESYSKKTLTFDKFGFEVGITWEAQQDSRVDLVDGQVQQQARQMREEMEAQAFTELTNNVGGTVGDADGVFTYDDVLSGRGNLLGKNYSPDLLIADNDAAQDLLGDANFLEASERGDMRRTAEIGQIAGFSVIEARDDHNITGTNNPGAVLVDTDFFGYEGTRWPVTSEQYTEKRNQTEVFRIYNRMGWLTTQPEAAVIIEG